VNTQENPRRRFLVNAGKTTVAAAAAGMVVSNALAADATLAKQIVRGKTKKVEILYQKTPTWESYYKRAF
jgi:hypothetical protein